MSICQTCSSELLSSQLKIAHLPSCCQTPICARCISYNPRLRDYTPCLRCGDPKTEELSGASSRSLGRAGRGIVDEGDRQIVGGHEEVVFEIGDDDEDLPPAYDEVIPGGETSQSPRLQEVLEEMPSQDSELTPSQPPDSEIVEDELETVEVRHPLKRGDSLLAIARKYAADPHEILTLNNLPHTVLTSHPHLLRTRSSLLISRRLVPRSSIPPSSAAPSLSSISAEESEKREKERQIKRFQLITKTLDPGVGAAYLALESLKDDQHPLESGSGESADGGKKDIPKGIGLGLGTGGRENRALEAFWEDEQWEKENARKDQKGNATRSNATSSGSRSGSGSGRGRWTVGGFGSFGSGVGVKS